MIQIIDNVLTREECNSLIAKLYDGSTPVRTRTGAYPVVFVPVVDFRNQSLMIDSKEVIRKVLCSAPHGLRVKRGHVEVRQDGQAGMPMHFDEAEPRTKLTSVTYLNDGFEGGETVIRPTGELSDRFDLKVTPRVGRTIFFDGAAHFHGVTQFGGVRYTMPMWFECMPADYPEKLCWWLD